MSYNDPTKKRKKQIEEEKNREAKEKGISYYIRPLSPTPPKNQKNSKRHVIETLAQLDSEEKYNSPCRISLHFPSKTPMNFTVMDWEKLIRFCKHNGHFIIKLKLESIHKKHTGYMLEVLKYTANIEDISLVRLKPYRLGDLNRILCDLPHLKKLNFSNCCFRAEPIKSLAPILKTIEILDLSDNGVFDLGLNTLMEVLCQSKKLKTLILDGSFLAEDCLILNSLLESSSSLDFLSLRGCSIGSINDIDEDIDSSVVIDNTIGLINTIKKNKALRQLCLSDNNLMEESILKAMIHTFTQHPSIECLQLSNCSFDLLANAFLIQLITDNKKISALDLSRNEFLLDSMLCGELQKVLLKNTVLKYLALSRTANVAISLRAQKILIAIVQNNNLSKLWLDDNCLSKRTIDNLLAALNYNVTINHISLLNNASAIYKPEIIRRNFSLLSINLPNADLAGQALTNTSHFDCHTAHNNKIRQMHTGMQLVKWLGEAGLVVIVFDYMSNKWRQPKKLHLISLLRMGNSPLTLDCLCERMPILINNFVFNNATLICDFSGFFKQLSILSALQQKKLMKAVSNSLQHKSKINELIINDLKNNPQLINSLEQLFVTEIVLFSLQDLKLDQKTFIKILQALKNNICFRQLNISGNKIGRAGANELIKLLFNMNSLKKITLDNNKVGFMSRRISSDQHKIINYFNDEKNDTDTIKLVTGFTELFLQQLIKMYQQQSSNAYTRVAQESCFNIIFILLSYLSEDIQEMAELKLLLEEFIKKHPKFKKYINFESFVSK